MKYKEGTKLLLPVTVELTNVLGGKVLSYIDEDGDPVYIYPDLSLLIEPEERDAG